MRCNWQRMRLLAMRRDLKFTEWAAGVFGVTAVICAATGDAMQFSAYAIASVFMLVLSRVK